MTSSWLGGFAVALLALPLGACGGGGTVNDSGGGGNDVVTDMDGGNTDDSTMMGTDGRQARDVNSGEVVLADTVGTCFVGVSPMHGAASATFVATGQGFSDPMVVIGILGPSGTAVGPPVTQPTMSDGMGSLGFMYTIPSSGLAPGAYMLSARDMSTFTCEFNAPFTITP